MATKNYVNFTGGLNYVDSPLNMNEKYLTEAVNCELGFDATIKKRNGFKLIANLAPSLSEGEYIKEIFYFSGIVIVFTSKAWVYTLDTDNVVECIWNDTIASELQTTVWTNNIGARCFGAVANDMFILSSGYNKPLQINFNLEVKCNYLHDPATGSNADVPMIYKCVMVNHYLCAICLFKDVGGVLRADNKLYVSAKDVPGLHCNGDTTGDAALAGSVEIRVDSIIPMTDQSLLDITSFRNEVCIITGYSIVIMQMDVYNEKTETIGGEDVVVRYHDPTVDTVVDNAGVICAGSTQLAYDSSLFLSANGINSIKRNVMSQNFIPESLSYKILPYIKSKFDNDLFEQGVHSYIDKRKFTYMIKWLDDTMLCMSFHKNLNEPCFWIWDNIRYDSFTNNNYGRVLASDKYGVFIYTDDSDGYCKDDYINETTKLVETSNFEMKVTTPWLFYGKPSNVKAMKNIKVFSDGKALFKFGAAFDLMDVVKQTVNGQVVDVDNYELEIDLLGGEQQGFGSGSNPYYGGGIISSNQNLIDFNQSFMYNKFRMISNDDAPLRVSCISVNYLVGGIRR